MSAASKATAELRGATLPRVEEQLRRRIVEGQIRPGDRLPSCREIARDLRVSHMSVHRALGALARDGFVAGESVRGTFVTDQPPHLFRYGVVFLSDPSGGERGYWPPAWRAINEEALRVQYVDPRRRVVPYYNITGHTDVPDFQKLLRDLHASRLAGLIFANGIMPGGLSSPLFQDRSLPRVMLYGPPVADRAVGISVGGWPIVTRALDYLAAQGRKRIAVIDVPDSEFLDEVRLTKEIEQRGMRTQPYWLLPINHLTPSTAKKTVRLLMSLPATERPDGLVVINPFLVEQATAGLVAAEVRVPKEADVVAGGNYPYLTRALVPVKWLGVDVREGMHQAIELIDRQRRGEAVPSETESQIIFEEELPAADPLKRLATQSKPADAATVGQNRKGEKS